MKSRRVTGKSTCSADWNGSTSRDSSSEKTTSAKLSESRPHSVSFNSSVNGASRRPCSSATRVKVDLILSLIDIIAPPPFYGAVRTAPPHGLLNTRLTRTRASQTHELFEGTI